MIVKKILIYKEQYSNDIVYNVVMRVYCDDDCILRECFTCDSFDFYYVFGRKILTLKCCGICFTKFYCDDYIVINNIVKESN